MATSVSSHGRVGLRRKKWCLTCDITTGTASKGEIPATSCMPLFLCFLFVSGACFRGANARRASSMSYHRQARGPVSAPARTVSYMYFLRATAAVLFLFLFLFLFVDRGRHDPLQIRLHICQKFAVCSTNLVLARANQFLESSP